MDHANTPGRYSATPKSLVLAGVPTAHLKIGDCITANKPLLINTVLGSCVSATFFHQALHLGGMFHAMLPTRDMSRGPGDPMPCKYADWAVEKIHTWFAQRGARVRDVEVKLFGGGFTIEPERKQEIRNIVDVGARNVEVARQTLESLGYRISRESVLGSTGRKLYFYTGTGEVWMKHIRPSLMAREVVP